MRSSSLLYSKARGEPMVLVNICGGERGREVGRGEGRRVKRRERREGD
jgi:hypothetical protein